MVTEGKKRDEEMQRRNGQVSARRLQGLRELIQRFETGGSVAREPYSSGLPTLDAALPGGGVSPGSIVEWLSSGAGSGTGLWGAAVIREACRRRPGWIVLVDRDGVWHPPALASLGLSLDRLLWVRPRDEAEERWVIDQSLRCSAVVAVWTAMERLEARWARRFRAAAEQANTLGIFERPLAAACSPSWADLQLFIRPLASEGRWRFEIEVVRGRGRVRGMRFEAEIDELDGAIRECLHVGERNEPSRRLRYWLQTPRGVFDEAPSNGDLVSRLAGTASRRRSARA